MDEKFRSADPEACYDPGRVYGLQGWRFNMRKGHRVKRIGFLQGQTAGARSELLEIAFHDHDAGDHMDGFVWLVPLPVGTVLHTVSASECRRSCRLTLDPKNADDFFVLAGFDVDHKGNDDSHLEHFSVGPISESANRPVIEVNFSDDDDFAYRATVQYAYVPRESVARRVPAIGGTYRQADDRTRPNLALIAQTPPGNAVLQEFHFFFQNGGHFLEDAGLERHERAYEAWFQDHQGEFYEDPWRLEERRHPDDPFDWTVVLMILR